MDGHIEIERGEEIERERDRVQMLNTPGQLHGVV